MESLNLPKIALVGIETDLYKKLDEHIGRRYNLLPIEHLDSLDLIGFPDDILLFIIDTDNPRIDREDILENIKETSYCENIPIIGLALKRHFGNMPSEERWNYEDILLMPCNTEDLLTRIDIWIKTYQIMCSEDTRAKSYSVD